MIKKFSTDVTEIKNTNTGQMPLQNWMLKSLNKSHNAKIITFLKSPTNTSPTAGSGASSRSPIGWASM